MSSKTKVPNVLVAAQADGTCDSELTKSPSIANRLEAAKNAEAFMTSFEASDIDVLPSGPRWKDDSLKEYFRTRFFRHDEIVTLKRQIQAEQFVQVTRTGAIMDIPFADIFEGDQFNEDDGTISKGMVKDKEKGCTIRESYLFLQPIGAYEALAKIRADRSGEYVSPKRRSNELAGRAAGHGAAVGAKSSDAIRITESELGTPDTSSGWEALGR